MKSNIFDKLVLENLVLTSDLKKLPIKVLEDFIVLEGIMHRENHIDERRKIFIYFDYNFYLDILIDIAKHKNIKDLVFSDVIVGNFIRIGNKYRCTKGFVLSNKKILCAYEQNKKL